MTERGTSQKSADAYRTISEVAEDLKLPQHVLRFWETRFPQVKPLKRAGGRRFYRREDVELLRAVKALLYGDGYTIKGVQRMLREQGPRALAALASGGSPPPGDGPPQRATGGHQEGERLTQDDVRHGPHSEGWNGPDVQARWPHWLMPSPDPGSSNSALGSGGASGEIERPAEGNARAASAADLVGRLQAVMFDMAECERLLAAARAVQG